MNSKHSASHGNKPKPLSTTNLDQPRNTSNSPAPQEPPSPPEQKPLKRSNALTGTYGAPDDGTQAKRLRYRTAYHFRDGTDYGTHNTEPGLTVQSEKDNTDINIIVGRFLKTGMLPQITTDPQFGDFSHVSDYKSAIESTRKAQEAFHTLPATVRKQFDNDPSKFLDFATNPANLDKLVEMGLATKPEPAPPAPAPKENDDGKK